MTKTAVVILNYNGQRFLVEFLPKIISLTPTAEVIVADNASTDGSVEFLKQNFPQIKLMVMDKNYGFAEGYNRALAELEHKYFVLLNSDIEVSEGWLEPMARHLEEHPDVAAIQPKILSYADKIMFEYAGAAGGFIDKLGYPFCRGRILNTVEKDSGQYDSPMEVDWATGACLMIRSSAYKNLGGLDGRFFAYQEEIDLCQRILGSGSKIICLPQSRVYHVGNGTLGKNSPFQTYLNFRNNLLMIYKNAPKASKILFYRLFLDILAGMNMLAHGEWKNFQSVLKARHDFRKMKPEFLQNRKENIARQASGVESFTRPSILLNYYLKGKKRFSDIFKNG